MGESDRYHDYKKIKRPTFTLGQPGNALFSLFAANVGAFFLILLVHVFVLFTQQGQNNSGVSAVEWFALPANLVTLTERPWTLLTFMFAQGGLNPLYVLLTMVSNMLWLWAFGYILQDLSGNRHIFPIYIYGSLAGAFLFLLAANSIPFLKTNKDGLYLFSAQYGTVAMAVAVTVLSPAYRLFKNIGKGIPVWLFASLYILITLLYAFKLTPAASFAVLGAALAGFIFVYLLKKGKDGSVWMHNFYNWCSNLFTPHKVNEQQATKEKVFYNTAGRKPFNKKMNITQQRIDEILDKINQHGYHFLTDDEKTILKRASEEDL